MQLWKILGIAGLVGFVGVAGVEVVRRRREWIEVEPTELQQRLHNRLAVAKAEGRVPT